MSITRTFLLALIRIPCLFVAFVAIVGLVHADASPDLWPKAAAIDSSQLQKQEKAEAQVLRWLEQGRGHFGQQKLLVKRNSEVGGLLATYQATNGKRIAFKAAWRTDGSIRAEIAHYSDEANRVVPLMARSRKGDDNNSILRLSDFDVIAELNQGAFSRRAPTNQPDAIAKFMASEEGVAFSEGVAALFAALDESAKTGDKLNDLHTMYGALLMSMQLSSGMRTDFDRVEQSIETQQATRARSTCAGLACKAAGRKFLIHPDGLFDILSKAKDVKHNHKSLTVGVDAGMPVAANQRNPLTAFRKNGDGSCENPFDTNPCFGKCGPGCFNPGDITTTECAGHDLCVCKWGHFSCAVSVPTGGAGCEGCHTLIEAAWSFVSAFFSSFGYEPPENPFDDPDSGAYWMGW